MLTHIRTSSWCELFCIWGYCTGDQGGFSVDPFMAMGIGPMLGRTQILSISAWNGNFIGKSHTLLIVETQNCVPLSFSSNGTCSLVAIRGKTKKKKSGNTELWLLSRQNVFNQNLWISLPLAHSLFISVHRL